MARVLPPKRGARLRTDRGRVDGVFLVDGKRTFRFLIQAERAERTPGGRLRTEEQRLGILYALWDAKCAEIQRELDATAGERMISTVFGDWIERAETKGLADETVRIHKLCRDYYLAAVGDHPLAALRGNPPRLFYDIQKADRYSEALRDKGLSPARVNTYLGRLASALRFAYRRGWIDREPEIERVKHRRARPKVPSGEHVRAMRRRLVQLCRHTNDDLQRYQYRQQRLLFYLLLFTGMRPMEARRLEREHVFLDRRAILLVNTKTGRVRYVRIGRFLAGKLRAHLASHPRQILVFEHKTKPGRPAWHRTAAMGKAMRRHMQHKDVDIAGAFKVLYGYRAGMATAGLNEIPGAAVTMRDQLGHTDLQTTLDHYIAGTDDAQLAMVDALEQRFFHPMFDRGMIEDRTAPLLAGS